MDFIVKRSRWVCGRGYTASKGVPGYGAGIGDACLLNDDGFMCCLGHCALQLGAKKKDILDVGMPDFVKFPLKVLTKKRNTVLFCTKLSNEAQKINDNSTITNEEREERLKKLFKKHKHTITFVGRYYSPKAK